MVNAQSRSKINNELLVGLLDHRSYRQTIRQSCALGSRVVDGGSKPSELWLHGADGTLTS